MTKTTQTHASEQDAVLQEIEARLHIQPGTLQPRTFWMALIQARDTNDTAEIENMLRAAGAQPPPGMPWPEMLDGILAAVNCAYSKARERFEHSSVRVALDVQIRTLELHLGIPLGMLAAETLADACFRFVITGSDEPLRKLLEPAVALATNLQGETVDSIAGELKQALSVLQADGDKAAVRMAARRHDVISRLQQLEVKLGVPAGSLEPESFVEACTALYAGDEAPLLAILQRIEETTPDRKPGAAARILDRVKQEYLKFQSDEATEPEEDEDDEDEDDEDDEEDEDGFQPGDLSYDTLAELNLHIIREAETYSDIVRLTTDHCYNLVKTFGIAGPIYPFCFREGVSWCLHEGCVYWFSKRTRQIEVSDMFYTSENPTQDMFLPPDPRANDPVLIYARAANPERDQVLLVLTKSRQVADLVALQAETKATVAQTDWTRLAIASGQATQTMVQVDREITAAKAASQAATAAAETPAVPTAAPEVATTPGAVG